MRGAGIVGLVLASLPLAGAAAQGWDQNYQPPRTADGHPSFEGTWTNASITTLERPPGVSSLVIEAAQADALVAMTQKYRDADAGPTDPNAPPPEAGNNVGGYNSFWIDPGERVAMIDGEYRTSWIVYPEDGKMPLTPHGEAIVRRREGWASFEDYDNPESRSAGERCTVGFGSTGGAPMLNVLYNNHYQFVQTPETVAIRVEMNHNTRLIRIGDEHQPASMPKWLGDSVGRWEGDTLVVHTTNFHPRNLFRPAIRHRIYLTEDAEVVERFTRVADDAILYRFEVTDPEVYTEPWRAEMVLMQDDQPIYEYACHEGNYSLPGILAGAREEERAGRGSAAEGDR